MHIANGIAIFFCLTVCHSSQGQSNSHWKPFPVAVRDNEVRELYSENDDSSLYLTGSFEYANHTIPCNVIKWDGATSTLLQSPLYLGLAMIKFQGKLFVSGNPGITFFDGNSWTRIDSSSSTAADCLAYFGNQLLFGGAFKKIAGHNIANGALWNGANNWSDFYKVDTLFEDAGWRFESMVEYKEQVYIGGNINPHGKPLITEIARFDGTSWKDVGGGIHGNALAAIWKMLVWKDELYVCGLFSERDGSPGNCIAKWDGTRWHKLGSGISNGQYQANIEGMEVYHDNLYVVGTFSEAGGIPADGFAKWDGRKWCSLGAKFKGGGAICLKSYKDELYVGGAFRSIDGDTALAKIAVWTGGDDVVDCSEPVGALPVYTNAFLEINPNPSLDGRFNISFTAQRYTDKILVTITNLTGQQVFHQQYNNSSTIFSTTVNLSESPKGIYFIEVASDGERLVRKIIVE